MGQHILNISPSPDDKPLSGGTILTHSDKEADTRETLARADGRHVERRS